MLIFSCMTYAQKKTVQVETGLNYPIGLVKDGNKENHLGFYLKGIYNLSNSPLSAGLKISYESYTVVMNSAYLKPLNGRSLLIQPAVVYNFPTSSKIECYAGTGLGAGIDNLETGVFNEGHKCHVVISPQVGVNIIKHFNISAQYNITHKDFSRLMVSVGYIF